MTIGRKQRTEGEGLEIAGSVERIMYRGTVWWEIGNILDRKRFEAKGDEIRVVRGKGGGGSGFASLASQGYSGQVAGQEGLKIVDCRLKIESVFAPSDYAEASCCWRRPVSIYYLRLTIDY